MKKWSRPLGALALLALVCLDPARAAASARIALARWATQVVPALLPFLIAIPALTCEEARALFARAMGGAMRLIDCPRTLAPVWLTGLLSGSPAGAAALAAGSAGCGDAALLRCAILSSGASPAFLLSAVGAGLLDRPQAGWMLVGAQALAGFAAALLMRPLPDAARRESALAPARPPALQGAIQALTMIGGCMALCAVLAGQLTLLLGAWAEKPLAMLLELDAGCRAAASLELPFPEKLALIAAVACMGGASVSAQSLMFLGKAGLRPAAYLYWKLVQSGFAALFALLAAAWMPALPLKEAPADAAPAALCALLLLLAGLTLRRGRGRLNASRGA